MHPGGSLAYLGLPEQPKTIPNHPKTAKNTILENYKKSNFYENSKNAENRRSAAPCRKAFKLRNLEDLWNHLGGRRVAKTLPKTS